MKKMFDGVRSPKDLARHLYDLPRVVWQATGVEGRADPTEDRLDPECEPSPGTHELGSRERAQYRKPHVLLDGEVDAIQIDSSRRPQQHDGLVCGRVEAHWRAVYVEERSDRHSHPSEVEGCQATHSALDHVGVLPRVAHVVEVEFVARRDVVAVGGEDALQALRDVAPAVRVRAPDVDRVDIHRGHRPGTRQNHIELLQQHEPGAIRGHGDNLTGGMHEEAMEIAILQEKLQELQAKHATSFVEVEVTIGNAHERPPGPVERHEMFEEFFVNVDKVQVAHRLACDLLSGRHDKADDLVVPIEQGRLLDTCHRELTGEEAEMRGDVVEVAEVQGSQQAAGSPPHHTRELGVVATEQRQELVDDDVRCPNEFDLV